MANDLTPKPDSDATGETTLITALTGLSDGVVKLVKYHLDLFRQEATRDAKRLGKDFQMVAIGALLGLIGYGFVLIAITLGMGALYPTWGSTITASILAFLHLSLGFWIAFGALQDIKKRQALEATKHQIERNSSWVKQLTDNSSKDLEIQKTK